MMKQLLITQDMLVMEYDKMKQYGKYVFDIDINNSHIIKTSYIEILPSPLKYMQAVILQSDHDYLFEITKISYYRNDLTESIKKALLEIIKESEHMNQLVNKFYKIPDIIENDKDRSIEFFIKYGYNI